MNRKMKNKVKLTKSNFWKYLEQSPEPTVNDFIESYKIHENYYFNRLKQKGSVII
jgi:hypothetical protein